MEFRNHSNLEGMHSFLSASKYHWIHYDMDKVLEVYKNERAKELGTRLHELASECIKLGIHLPSETKTINLFVNDAIDLHMSSEVVLYYSMNAFGTADAISYDGCLLRIHDLKTGKTPAHFEQLMVYAAYFCLEYDINPTDIQIELRLYQSNEVKSIIPEPEMIAAIMNTIVIFDKAIDEYKLLEHNYG